MRTKIRRLALLGMLMGALLGTGLMAPATAAGTTQIGGDAVFDTTVCNSPPAGFTSYDGLRLTGSLEGCLYTGIVDSQVTPSGGYIETGHEMFVGKAQRRCDRDVHDQLPVPGQVRGGLHR